MKGFLWSIMEVTFLEMVEVWRVNDKQVVG
jgi:hypothetical protein